MTNNCFRGRHFFESYCITPKSHLMRQKTYVTSLLEHKAESFLLYKSKIKIVTSKGISIISKDQVDYVKSESNYSIVHLNDGNQIFCCRTLKDLSAKLPKSEFVRVHASYLVNLSRIVFISSNYSSLTLDNDDVIPISRSQKTKFKSIIQQHFD